MCAAFGDPAGVDDQDLVGFPDGGEPVRDHQRGPAGERRFKRALYGDLGFGVQVRGRLVEHYHRRGLQQEPGHRDTLLLPARQPVAPVPHHGVQAIGQAGD